MGKVARYKDRVKILHQKVMEGCSLSLSESYRDSEKIVLVSYTCK